MFKFRLKVRCPGRPAGYHGVVAAVAIAALAAAWLQSPPPARAQSYPTWEEVRQAKGDVEAKAAQIAEIEGLLDGLQQQAGELGNEAVAASAGYAEAEAALGASDRRIQVLATQRHRAEQQAADLRRRAGELAAQTYKTGATNQALLVLLDVGPAEETLQSFDMMQVVADRTGRLYEEAAAAEHVSAGLVAQEEEARAERSRLADAAGAAWSDAEQASRAADDKVAEQQERSAELLEQLAELKDTSVRLEEERRQGLAAEASYRAQQEAAAAAAREQVKADGASAGPEPTAGSARAAAGPAGPGTAEAPVPAAGPGRQSSAGQERSAGQAQGSGQAGSPGSSTAPAPVPVQAPPGSEGSGSSGSGGPGSSSQPAQPSPAPAPPQSAAPVAAVNDPAGAQAYASGRLGSFGWGQDQFQCLVNLWNRESNWRTTAHNPASGAYGIPQSLPGDKMAAAGADWRTSYRTQVDWGLGYIKGRYGSPCGAWGHSENNGWY